MSYVKKCYCFLGGLTTDLIAREFFGSPSSNSSFLTNNLLSNCFLSNNVPACTEHVNQIFVFVSSENVDFEQKCSFELKRKECLTKR